MIARDWPGRLEVGQPLTLLLPFDVNCFLKDSLTKGVNNPPCDLSVLERILLGSSFPLNGRPS